jgi:flagellar export protein FliJ
MARQGVAGADAALAAAKTESGEQTRKARAATDLQWYRFWILRLEHERKAALAMLAARDGEVAAASAACIRAKQRCESLERLREKARLAHSQAEAEAERKVIDELATRRFSVRRQDSEGATR